MKTEEEKFKEWLEKEKITNFHVDLNEDLFKITDSDRLIWLIENIDHKPKHYDGQNYGRFDFVLPSEDTNLIRTVDAKIIKERKPKITEKIYKELNKIIENLTNGNYEEYSDF